MGDMEHSQRRGAGNILLIVKYALAIDKHMYKYMKGGYMLCDGIMKFKEQRVSSLHLTPHS